MHVSVELMEYEGDALFRIPRTAASQAISFAFVEVWLRAIHAAEHCPLVIVFPSA
jgi:hypothetical protein